MLHFTLLHHGLWPVVGIFLRKVNGCGCPKDDLRDSSSWSSPPLQILRDIHVKLITLYDCKEVCAPTQSKVNVGSGDYRLCSQDDFSHHQGSGPLSLPQLNHPQQRIVTTVEDSVIWTEMTDLEKLRLRKRIPPSVSSSLSWWVDWDRSGLTVETKPGLFLTTDKVKTQQHVTKSRSRHCVDVMV